MNNSPGAGFRSPATSKILLFTELACPTEAKQNLKWVLYWVRVETSLEISTAVEDRLGLQVKGAVDADQASAALDAIQD